MQTESRPIIWSIAGSDSGGGAGIQADLISIQALGGHAATALSSITAQNSLGVQAVKAVELSLFQQQLCSLAADLAPRAIKIGLLGDVHQVHCLRQMLPVWRRRWPDLFVVLDPVLVANSGDALTTDDMVAALRDLLPYVDLVTPNLPELATLSGLSVQTQADSQQAAAQLATQGCAVLAKGGHHQATPDTAIEDQLVTEHSTWRFLAERLPTQHTHGTGCTLSSAIAALVAQGLPLHDACALARAYLQQGLRQAYATGTGAGTPLRSHTLADCLQPNSLPRCGFADDHWLSERLSATPGHNFASCLPQGIYPVVPDCHWVERVLQAGARVVQLRIKQPLDSAQLEQKIRQAIALGKRYRRPVFINDHWRYALKLGAYGVHLGQEDIQTADLDALRAAGLRLGVSSHGYAELLRVLPLKPSYVALGHIFTTATKIMPSQPQGLARLAELQRIATAYRVPTVAIGGIKSAHLPAIRRLGVNCVAVVTAITAAPSPEESLQAMQQQLCNASPQPITHEEHLSHD